MNEKHAPILIVDDEPEMCWILESIIRKAGFTSLTALSAREAISLTKSNKFSRAFLDAKLSDIDGLELARQLHNANIHLPIIIVSGYFYQDDQSIRDALQSGVITGFIGKPFDNDEIVRIITPNAHR